MKRTSLRPVSAKRARLMVERRHFVKDLLERRPWCEARLEGCAGRAIDVHERLNRSQGGRIVGGEESEYMALCRPCHSWITTHPRESRQRGFSVQR